MNTSTAVPSHAPPQDPDLAEQARPGHGIPSQDPNPAAQISQRPEEAEREAKSVLAGGGLVGGAALGATVGVVVAGPAGVVVGGALGAVAGALGGVAAGTVMTPGETSGTDPVTGDSGPAHIGVHAIAGGVKR
jgi:hypothetical protein